MSSLSEKLSRRIRQTDIILKLAWAGEILSSGIYVLIAYLAARTAGVKPSADIVVIMSCTFGFAGFMITAFAIVFHGIFLSARAAANFASGRMPNWASRQISPQPYATTGSGEAEGIPEEEKGLYAYSRGIFRLYLIFYGLPNACAIFGLALAIIAKRPELVFPFVGISFLVMLLHFPNLSKTLEDAKSIAEYNAE